LHNSPVNKAEAQEELLLDRQQRMEVLPAVPTVERYLKTRI